MTERVECEQKFFKLSDLDLVVDAVEYECEELFAVYLLDVDELEFVELA